MPHRAAVRMIVPSALRRRPSTTAKAASEEAAASSQATTRTEAIRHPIPVIRTMIDDTDVRQIDPADLRRAIGSVLQDVHLFSGTVRENIALDRPDVTDEDILRAAKISGVHDFIGGMPQGYGLVLKERGEGLSGGQRQALCMARALVASPDILILDEPTSMMDVASELQLIERLRWEIKDRTLLAVTHRGSMMKLVDRAIILDRGKVVADGAKDRVLASLQRSVKGAET